MRSGPAPYELTRDEYKRHELDDARAAVTPREEPRPGAFYMYSRRERARLDEAARHFAYISKPGVLDDEHRRAVADALSSGKKVPARVLAEYPDLAGRRVPLSRAVDKFNRANEPPGGFSDADLVRNAHYGVFPYARWTDGAVKETGEGYVVRTLDDDGRGRGVPYSRMSPLKIYTHEKAAQKSRRSTELWGRRRQASGSSARPLGLAPTSTAAAPVHSIVVGALVVGTVGGAVLLGRMFVNALATR